MGFDFNNNACRIINEYYEGELARAQLRNHSSRA